MVPSANTNEGQPKGVALAPAAPGPGTDAAAPAGVVDDAACVAAILRGERGAFADLYQRHKEALFRTAMAITHERGAAEELLQEGFLRAYRFMDRVQLAPGASLRPWLHRILINLCYDWCARQRHEAPADDDLLRRLDCGHPSPERQTVDRDQARGVAEAVALLPFKQRIVVILFYLQDMDLQEIATTLALPAGTVKSRLHYGRVRLREIMEAGGRLDLPLAERVAHAPLVS